MTMWAIPLLLSGIAIAQTPDSKRIEALERRVEQLERRNVPAKQGAPRGKEAWRSLSIGMTKDQVKAALGEPGKIDTTESRTWWYWNYPSGGSVIFNENAATAINEP